MCVRHWLNTCAWRRTCVCVFSSLGWHPPHSWWPACSAASRRESSRLWCRGRRPWMYCCLQTHSLPPAAIWKTSMHNHTHTHTRTHAHTHLHDSTLTDQLALPYTDSKLRWSLRGHPSARDSSQVIWVFHFARHWVKKLFIRDCLFF